MARVGSFPGEGKTLQKGGEGGGRQPGAGFGGEAAGQVPPARGAERQTAKKNQLANSCGWGRVMLALFAKGAGNNTCSCASVEGEVPRSLPHLSFYS